MNGLGKGAMSALPDSPAKTCTICDQILRDPTSESHHLERSPIEPKLCLGCWIGWMEMEKFLLRATGRTFWSLQVQDAMRQFLIFTLGRQAR